MIQIIIAILFAKLAETTVGEFLFLMRKLDCLRDHIIVKGIKKRDRIDICELDTSAMRLIPIKNIPCKFYGGPPKGRGTYSGSLLSLLIDRILTVSLIHENYSIFDLLKFDS